jgi:hypothetical protein
VTELLLHFSVDVHQTESDLEMCIGASNSKSNNYSDKPADRAEKANTSTSSPSISK